MRKSAFTLVELLIVIMIIGILATMAVPQYNKMVEKARSAEAVSILGTIRQMEIVYYAQWNAYLDVDQKWFEGSSGQQNWAILGMDDPNQNTSGKFYYNANPWSGGDPSSSSSWTIDAWPRKFGDEDPHHITYYDRVMYIWLDSGEIGGGLPH